MKAQLVAGEGAILQTPDTQEVVQLVECTHNKHTFRKLADTKNELKRFALSSPSVILLVWCQRRPKGELVKGVPVVFLNGLYIWCKQRGH